MAAAFFLSPAETCPIESLPAGRSLRETTGALGVAMTTAKTHLEKATRLSLIDRGLPRRRVSMCPVVCPK
jgi:hypothetical protein